MGGPGMGGPGMGAPRGGGTGMGGPGMGGPGMGGPGMGEPGMSGPPQIKVTVRWESALPVREATGRQIKDGEAYLISVSGLSAPRNRRGQQGEGDEGQRRDQIRARLKEVTRIERKGKEPLVPEAVEAEDSGQTPVFLFRFPHGADPISADDKEVTFITRLGPMEVKAKFALKDMVYQGRLEL